MARKKISTLLDPPPNDCDQGGLDQLTSTVDTLSKEVRVLREAIDELRELLGWAMQNREEVAAGNHPLFAAAGIPREAVDKEGDEKIHRTESDDRPDEDEERPSTAALGQLF